MDMKSEEDFRVIRQLAVKVNGDEKDALRQIKDFYASKGFSEDEIHVQTYNEINRNLYYMEDQNMQLITVFTGLILLLSVMAMIAMSTYYARQHARQTAIRKVMGCSRSKVFVDTARGFLYAVGIAVLTAAFVMLAVAVVSISWQAVRLMDTDPVDALKSE